MIADMGKGRTGTSVRSEVSPTAESPLALSCPSGEGPHQAAGSGEGAGLTEESPRDPALLCHTSGDWHFKHLGKA